MLGAFVLLATLGSLTPRNRLVRQILLAAAAIERSDPTADGIVGGAVQRARQEGFINTLVSTAPQVTGYLVEHAPSFSLRGGTREILRGIIARGLGLR